LQVKVRTLGQGTRRVYEGQKGSYLGKGVKKGEVPWVIGQHLRRKFQVLYQEELFHRVLRFGIFI